MTARITTGRRLHVQDGNERCLFFSSTASVIRELCSVFMVRGSFRVPLLMFQIGTSSKNLHKIAENTNVCTEEDKYSYSNILGQYAWNGSNDGRNSHIRRHCNLPSATFGFCFNPNLGGGGREGVILPLCCFSLNKSETIKALTLTLCSIQ